jgi:hypothetical protein
MARRLFPSRSETLFEDSSAIVADGGDAVRVFAAVGVNVTLIVQLAAAQLSQAQVSLQFRDSTHTGGT